MEATAAALVRVEELERALTGRHFIHTHVGFGYRLDAEASHPFHTASTGR